MITGVIFGVHTPDNLKTEIIKIFGNAVEYKQAQLDFENWQLSIKKYNPCWCCFVARACKLIF
jgi:hypothetical protein